MKYYFIFNLNENKEFLISSGYVGHKIYEISDPLFGYDGDFSCIDQFKKCKGSVIMYSKIENFLNESEISSRNIYGYILSDTDIINSKTLLNSSSLIGKIERIGIIKKGELKTTNVDIDIISYILGNKTIKSIFREDRLKKLLE